MTDYLKSTIQVEVDEAAFAAKYASSWNETEKTFKIGEVDYKLGENAFTSVQDAVLAVTDGGTVNIGAGTFGGVHLDATYFTASEVKAINVVGSTDGNGNPTTILDGCSRVGNDNREKADNPNWGKYSTLDWNKKVTFSNLKFMNTNPNFTDEDRQGTTGDAKNGVDKFAMQLSSNGAGAPGVSFDNCVFQGSVAGKSELLSIGRCTNGSCGPFTFDDCTFDEGYLYIWRGNNGVTTFTECDFTDSKTMCLGVTQKFISCDFSYAITAADAGDYADPTKETKDPATAQDVYLVVYDATAPEEIFENCSFAITNADGLALPRVLDEFGSHAERDAVWAALWLRDANQGRPGPMKISAIDTGDSSFDITDAAKVVKVAINTARDTAFSSTKYSQYVYLTDTTVTYNDEVLAADIPSAGMILVTDTAADTKTLFNNGTKVGSLENIQVSNAITGDDLENGVVAGYNLVSGGGQAVAAMDSTTKTIELLTDSTSAFPYFESNNDDDWAKAVAYDLNFVTNQASATAVLGNGSYAGFRYTKLKGNLSVGENVTLDFTPSKQVQGFLQINNEEKDLAMNIDGTLKFYGGDFGSYSATDNSPKLTINVSETGKFLADEDTDNTTILDNTVLTVTGTGDSETKTKMSEVQFRMGGYGYLGGAVTMTDTNAVIGTIASTSLGGSEKMTVTNSILTTRSNEEEETYTALISNKTVELKDCQTVFGSLDIQSKSITVDGGSLTVAGTYIFDGGVIVAAGNASISAGAALSLSGAAFTAGAFTNNGALALDAESTVKVVSFAGDGKITMDMEGADQNYYKIIDVTGTGDVTYDLDDVTLLNAGDYRVGVSGNDLMAVSTKTVKVNTSWTKDTELEAGFIWNVNAFNDLQTAFNTCHDGTRTYEYTSATANQILTLNVEVTEGSSSVSFGTADDSKSYTVLGNKTIQSEITKNTTYILAFNGDGAAYTITPSYQSEITHEEPIEAELKKPTDPSSPYDVTYTSSETTVGYCTDENQSAQKYEFTVGTNASGEYTITITPTIPEGETAADRISYVIKGVNDNKKYASGSATGTVSRTVKLTGGDYIVEVDSYDHGKGKYETAFTVSIDANVNTDVSSADDAFNGTSVTTLSANSTTGSKFVGLGDKTDWIKLGIASTGKYTVTLDPAASGDTIAAGLRVYLVQVEGTKKTTLKSATYKAGSVEFSNVLLDAAKCNDAGNGYYIQVSASNASTSSYNATYKVALSDCTANSGVSSADDTWKTARTLAAGGAALTDWVGTEDEVDYVKLTDMVAGKSYNLTLGVDDDGTRIFATIYRQKGDNGNLSTVASFNGYANKDAVTKTFACASGYNYYVRFKTAAGTDVSNGYTASLAQK